MTLPKRQKKKGYDTYCFFGRGKKNEDIRCIKIGNSFSVFCHAFIARIGFNGHGSYFATKKLVKQLKKINPDVIHLHNIHGYYVNLKILFNYLKNSYKGKIVWTLHDCWAFTGHCAHFTIVNCKKWKKKCYNCPQLFCYPKQIFDTTKSEYYLKKELFTGLNNLTIVTPSNWLKDLVKKSFLKNYNIKVINNGIDLNIFKPTYDESVYAKYNIPKDKKIILGVANIWEERKGLNDFLELSKKINDKYQIILIGIDERKKGKLPSNIIGIKRTDNNEELSNFYSLATVLFNPTYEDNYPTVNLESIACHTSVITYDTGGCKEQIEKYNYGYIVEKKDYDTIIKLLDKIKKKNISDNKEMCVSQMVFKYIQIYVKE